MGPDPADEPFPQNQFFAAETWILLVEPPAFDGNIDPETVVMAFFREGGTQIEYLPLFSDSDLADRFRTSIPDMDPDAKAYQIGDLRHLERLVVELQRRGTAAFAYDASEKHVITYPIENAVRGLRRKRP